MTGISRALAFALCAFLCAALSVVNAGTIGTTRAVAYTALTNTGAISDLTVVLQPIPTTLTAGGRVVMQLPTQMTIYSTTSCGVVHGNSAVAGVTTRTISTRTITWTLSTNMTLTNTASLVTVLVCSNVANARMEISAPLLSVSTYASGGTVALDTNANVAINAFVRSPLGAVIRQAVPTDPRGNATTTMQFTISPLTNSLISGDSMDLLMPLEFYPTLPTDGVSKSGTQCTVTQAAVITTTTSIDSSLITIRFQGPVLNSEPVYVSCTLVRNPTTARGMTHSTVVRTRASNSAVIDQTLEMSMAAITRPADPSAKSFVMQSFVVYRRRVLTQAQRLAVQNIYCEQTSATCGTAHVMWQYRSFAGDSLTLSVGVYPRTGASTTALASAITSANLKIVGRIRELLSIHDIEIGTAVSSVIPGSCFNGVRDDGETGVDCGGTACPQCADTAVCVLPSDCTSFNCIGNVCRDPDYVVPATTSKGFFSFLPLSFSSSSSGASDSKASTTAAASGAVAPSKSSRLVSEHENAAAAVVAPLAVTVLSTAAMVLALVGVA